MTPVIYEILKNDTNELRTVPKTSETTLRAPTFELQGSQKKKRIRKGLRKYWKRLQLKTSLIWERKQSISPEAQRVPYWINRRRNTPRHILIKVAKIKYKGKILKAAREKQQITYKGTPIRLIADFSAETLQARREWHDIFKVMKGKNMQPRLLYPVRISFKFDREIKSFTDKQKLKFSQRIQHHKTSSTTNAKGTSLSGKHKRSKGPTKTNPKLLRKL